MFAETDGAVWVRQNLHIYGDVPTQTSREVTESDPKSSARSAARPQSAFVKIGDRHYKLSAAP